MDRSVSPSGPKDRPHSISDIVLPNEYLRHRLYKMCADVRAIARSLAARIFVYVTNFTNILPFLKVIFRVLSYWICE